MFIKNCLTCNKEFRTFPSEIKRGHGRYCSPKCRPGTMKGKKHSLETRKRISEIQKGKKISLEIRKKISESQKGRRVSTETRRKISLAHKGSKNYRWKGGKTINTEGYILIKKPEHPFANGQNYILEHRLVIEKEIGRYLKHTEHVHHIGKRDDNRPHMLMAFASISAHVRFHKNPDNVNPEEIIFDGRKLNLT